MKKIYCLLFFIFFSLSSLAGIKVGSYINDIHNLELRSQSYQVDLYIWFKWTDKELNPAESFEFMNPFELWSHTVTKSYEKPIKLPTGEYYQVIRIEGGFTHKFDLENYPFDKQYLTVEFEDSDSIEHNIEMTLDGGNYVTMNPDLKFPGFILGAPQMEIIKKVHPTNFGDIRKESLKTTFSRVKLKIPINRPVVTYIVKLILPILCVVFSTCLIFLFKPTYVDSRVGIGITSLLTIVALQITLNDELPEIDYLVLMDKIYILTWP